MLRFTPLIPFLLVLHSQDLQATKLDLGVEYRLRGLSYSNPDFDSSTSDTQAFYSQRAFLGFSLKNIVLGNYGGETQDLDVTLRLQALSIAGSSSPVKAPFDRIGSRYPNTNFTPWVQNAYLKASNLFGFPWQLIIGRQPLILGSGLILSDDDLGTTAIKAEIPFSTRWIDLESQIFTAKSSESQTGDRDLDLHGLSFKIPSEGVWELAYLLERDKSQPAIKSSVKNFFSLRYSLEWDQISFDGESAWQQGTAKSAAQGQSDTRISGNAVKVQGAWRQPVSHYGEGKARLLFGFGSGDKSSTLSKDESFFPSLGHRFNGLERSGFGEFYGASLYDALGGSSTTARGLPPGASGIQVVGLGITLPPWKKITLDLDYFVFHAQKVASGNRSLGSEFDSRLSYSLQDKLFFSLTAALFSPGEGSRTGPNKSSAKRLKIEATGRF